MLLFCLCDSISPIYGILEVMNINAKTEKELLKRRAAQAAYTRAINERWAAVGGRPKPAPKAARAPVTKR